MEPDEEHHHHDAGSASSFRRLVLPGPHVPPPLDLPARGHESLAAKPASLLNEAILGNVVIRRTAPGDSLMDLIAALNTLLPIAFLLTLSTFLVWLHEQQD